jgi:hypothetical protein
LHTGEIRLIILQLASRIRCAILVYYLGPYSGPIPFRFPVGEAGIAELFRTDDPVNALINREIYHHRRDIGRALRRIPDNLHHAVVGLV